MTNTEDSDVGAEGGFVESIRSTKEAVYATISAMYYFTIGLQHWTQRRGRLTQFVLAGIVTAGINRFSEAGIALLGTVHGLVPEVSTVQLLAALVAIATAQTVAQTRTLIKIRIQLDDTMSEGRLLADGGRESTAAGRRTPPVEVETTGGGAIGGAIVGAALGASFGPGGIVGGALLGSILGDDFEAKFMIPSPHDP